MKICYLILSHNKPHQLLRLVKALRSGNSSSEIIIHHDLKAAALDKQKFEPYEIRLVPEPVSVLWGDFSMVQSMLNSFSWALENVAFDWLVVLSGQDYPIQPIDLIERDLANSNFDAYINGRLYDVPGIWPDGLGFSRYFFQYMQMPRNNYYYLVPEFVRNFIKNVRGSVNSYQDVLRFYPRYLNRPALLGIRSMRNPFDEAFRCYVGSQWFSARKKCIEYIIDFVHKNGRVVDYYRRTMIPDESFFMTLLYNHDAFNIERDNNRYINWSADNNASHPLNITADDLPQIFASGKHFARKFDLDVQPAVLDMVDGHLNKIP